MISNAGEWKAPTVNVHFSEEDSSVVEEMQFKKNQSTGKFELMVYFRSGYLYRYFDVDQEAISNILFANSIGSAFNSEISQTTKYVFEKMRRG
ncbi:hypothetical protein CL620_06265 [archaeon]|jgi:hypothetical protein|nr:hypothetical protein [archaeon]|tara:strand:+ start:1339 stop:1617 length:279 start_codon:yes stop_codon:yes gene_type:complete